MNSESDNLKFQQKCKDLKKRVGEIDENNEAMTIALGRTKLAIKRLRLESAILLERLEKKINPSSFGVSASAKEMANKGFDSKTVSYSSIPSPELPALKLSDIGANGATGNGRRKNGAGKAKAKQRDPNQPKRPTNSYLIFCELEKDKIKQKLDSEGPPGHLYDMSKALTEAWKHLNDEDKKPYVKLYEDDRQRYNRELKIYHEKKDKEAAAAAAATAAASCSSTTANAGDKKLTPTDPKPSNNTETSELGDATTTADNALPPHDDAIPSTQSSPTKKHVLEDISEEKTEPSKKLKLEEDENSIADAAPSSTITDQK
ncbi:Nhp10 protein [Saccharomycopsis crataegensis]|uniref:Nhp10 protein n=1 Tax=Saccharomycopsis crataegensis TaxID=43959 RepID=A0AAV5QI28_9ASCO|nr:Nhp10 protein [Saccharomycopsis crataegensis]